MEIREYWRVIRRRFWVPVLLALGTTITGGVIALAARPSYIATATVVAKAPSNTSDKVVAYPDVVASYTVAQRVIDRLGQGGRPVDLMKQISVSAGHSDLFQVSVSDADPGRAVALANAVGQESARLYQQLNATTGSVFDQDIQDVSAQFERLYEQAVKDRITFDRAHPLASRTLDQIAKGQQLALREQAAAGAYGGFIQQTMTTNAVALGNFGAGVVDPAVARPDTSTRLLKVAASAALAFALGVGLMFLFEHLDNAVRMPEAVEEMVGVPVLGIIPMATPPTLRQAKGGAA